MYRICLVKNLKYIHSLTDSHTAIDFMKSYLAFKNRVKQVIILISKKIKKESDNSYFEFKESARVEDIMVIPFTINDPMYSWKKNRAKLILAGETENTPSVRRGISLSLYAQLSFTLELPVTTIIKDSA